MATYHLMLTKVGLEKAETIENTAAYNWNKWTPWPYWYRHILSAQEIYSSLPEQTEGFVELNSAKMIAESVINAHPYNKWIHPWLIHRWHEIIADTRGNWFALWVISKLSLFVSLALLFIPVPIFKIIAIVLFGCSAAGLWIIAKIFRLNSNANHTS